MDAETSIVPNPGAPEARGRGCTCPVIDNHYGEGRPTVPGPTFVYTVGCPLHWPERGQWPPNGIE